MKRLTGLTTALAVLRQPLYLGITLVLTVLLSWLYTALSLRSAGMETTVLTTDQTTPQFQIETFGPAYYYGGVALDLLVAFFTAVLVALTIAAYRARRRVEAGPVGAAASLAIAATSFG
jgi:hypothetical protein